MVLINNIVYYGIYHLDLKDEIYATNCIMDVMKVFEIDSNVNKKFVEELTNPEPLLEQVVEYALTNSIINELEIDMFTTKIMGFITPSQSTIHSNISKLHAEKQLDYLFDIGVKSNYIKTKAIQNNIVWKTDNINPPLTITINLSKPEKDNKQIELLLKEKKTNYPACMLCKENLGYPGRINYPARQTLRFIPIELDKEEWFIQYSPYAYFHKHLIVFNSKHVNMKVDETTIVKLLDFVDKYPTYFIGSNASLPRVGGSILNHEHYQGGYEKLPLMYAGIKKEYKINFDAKIFEVDWFTRTIRVTSKSRESIEKIYNIILENWLSFTDESINILSKTTEKHNAMSPIVYMQNNEYTLDIILRNNRVDETFIDGIFHAHPQYHSVKKEGIGLIEAMGLFILPGRLKNELQQISKFITGNECDESIIKKHDYLVKQSNKSKNITDEINNICRNILQNISVFKDDELGNESFVKFMNNCNFK